ncbi:MAG: acyl carrier protein [Kibdelosporangium sp.]
MHVGPDSTPAQLQEWLAGRIAGYLDIPPGRLDPDQPFAEIGLDSVYALTLCGDVEDALGIEVEPTMAWDHPTTTALAQGIHDELRSRAGTADG